MIDTGRNAAEAMIENATLIVVKGQVAPGSHQTRSIKFQRRSISRRPGITTSTGDRSFGAIALEQVWEVMIDPGIWLRKVNSDRPAQFPTYADAYQACAKLGLVPQA